MQSCFGDNERVREGVISVFWECVAFFWSHVVCAVGYDVLCEGLSCVKGRLDALICFGNDG